MSFVTTFLISTNLNKQTPNKFIRNSIQIYVFEFLTKRFITSHYYVCVNEDHKVAFAVSRLFYHQVLLRYYSPLLCRRLQEIGIEPEVYVWDWFVQCFMGIFTLDQCYVILDLLFSLQFNDNILICLSIAILDELKSIILKVQTLFAFHSLTEQFRKGHDDFYRSQKQYSTCRFPANHPKNGSHLHHNAKVHLSRIRRNRLADL